MTNTNVDGTAVLDSPCQNFTSASEEEALRLGTSAQLDSHWTSYATGGCISGFYSYHLYCFEQ